MAADVAPGQKLSGGCLCGAVRFTAAPVGHDVAACHCSMCRKWTAGPFLALECGGTIQIADPSSLGIYRSSEWAERGFCTQCGTSLFYRMVGKDFYVVSAEAFDDPSAFQFTSQIFVDEKPPYYDFANATKNMTGPEVFAAMQAAEAQKG